MNKRIAGFVFLFAAAFSVFFGVRTSDAEAKVNYTVNTTKVRAIAKSTHPSITNQYSQDYLGFNIYLSKMEEAGGGTLTVKKGTYYIAGALFVPSNTTIVFEDGVVFKKITTTGTSIKAATSMWQLCPYSKSKKTNVIGKYNGSKNVTFKCKGKVVFDMGNNTGICIILAHNKNVDISGITFKGMNGSHYIEINGSKNVTVHDNRFSKAKNSTKKKYYNKEAINIDLADKATNGLNLDWVKKDKTPCVNITIENNTFAGTTRGVGTHKYSQTKNGKNIYHKNIVIKNNTFRNIYDNGIFALNWKNTTITGNKFINIGNKSKKPYSSGRHAISGGGIVGMTITGNTFKKIKYSAVYFCMQKNNGAGSKYDSIVVTLTEEELLAMKDNKVINCGYDMNDVFSGYDVLYFEGDSQRTK